MGKENFAFLSLLSSLFPHSASHTHFFFSSNLRAFPEFQYLSLLPHTPVPLFFPRVFIFIYSHSLSLSFSLSLSLSLSLSFAKDSSYDVKIPLDSIFEQGNLQDFSSSSFPPTTHSLFLFLFFVFFSLSLSLSIYLSFYLSLYLSSFGQIFRGSV